MPANTSPDNIVYPTVGDQVAPLEGIFQDLADSVQDALNTRQLRTYRWANAAARTAETGMQAGDEGYQSDTFIKYRYSGSAWVVVGEDTGWINVPLINSAVSESGNTFQYRRKNGWVSFRGRVVPTSNASGTTFAQLPVGFRVDGNTGASGNNIFICDSGAAVRVNIPTDTGTASLASTGAGAVSFGGNTYIAK